MIQRYVSGGKIKQLKSTLPSRFRRLSRKGKFRINKVPKTALTVGVGTVLSAKEVTVSYTHLDVYKRQSDGWSIMPLVLPWEPS